MRACELFPWTPSVIFDWTWSWLHVLAYGEEAKQRPCRGFYGPMPNGVTWVLQYPDIDKIVDELDADDRRRHRAV